MARKYSRSASREVKSEMTIELVRENTDHYEHAVAFRHGGVHIVYVPKRHFWLAHAIDDGRRLLAIVDKVKVGGIFRRRAKSVGVRVGPQHSIKANCDVQFTSESRHFSFGVSCPLTAKSGHSAPYSMTSSSRASTVDGIVMPIAFAVLRLITNSYLAEHV
jgi:hypothetical protein